MIPTVALVTTDCCLFKSLPVLAAFFFLKYIKEMEDSSELLQKILF